MNGRLKSLTFVFFAIFEKSWYKLWLIGIQKDWQGWGDEYSLGM